VLQSERFTAELDRPNLLPGIGWELPFSAVVSRVYKMEASTNLVNWENLATFTNLSERNVLMDRRGQRSPALLSPVGALKSMWSAGNYPIGLLELIHPTPGEDLRLHVAGMAI
jgi:hypothetical protein